MPLKKKLKETVLSSNLNPVNINFQNVVKNATQENLVKQKSPPELVKES